jgi:hypothetical protein
MSVPILRTRQRKARRKGSMGVWCGVVETKTEIRGEIASYRSRCSDEIPDALADSSRTGCARVRCSRTISIPAEEQ